MATTNASIRQDGIRNQRRAWVIVQPSQSIRQSMSFAPVTIDRGLRRYYRGGANPHRRHDDRLARSSLTGSGDGPPDARHRAGSTAPSTSGPRPARPVWDGGEPLTTIPSNYEQVKGRPRAGLVHLDQIPIQPWARRCSMRGTNGFSRTNPTRAASPHPPHARCRPPMGSSSEPARNRTHLSVPDRWRASFRLIYLDGRSHPVAVEPSFLGIRLAGGTETRWSSIRSATTKAWMERWGMPHTDRLHTIERITRLDFDTLKSKSRLTIRAYTAPWTSGYTNAGPRTSSRSVRLPGKQLRP